MSLMRSMIFRYKAWVAPKLNNHTATYTIMLILKGKRTDGADLLRRVKAHARKQQKFHCSFYKPRGHREGGIQAWLSRDYFTIQKGRARNA